ncbi:N-acetylmuramoyl-L-alanine amidase [Brevibacillus humidisoli]|uniref:N-acetylmuramoyl-L-alanine amidase family protein n=1 Tax=Brevibacillus humidisoli TaxID=2895522 RepID=UPI001E4EDF1F|nr:N-acetylmuramoyl-L-alanine amidase [Brevibacillus humidisoli]UFJ39213.1 N-acetylmuramoyl-L-alanine amidase [Brevibacillus humidisoli]
MLIRVLAAIWIYFVSSLLFPSIGYAVAPLPSVDVLIDAGHGGVDSGAFYQDLYEKEINLQVAKRLYDELAKRGRSVVLNRTGDYALSDENQWLKIRSRHVKDLAQRAQLARQITPKVMISLHVNWSGNPRVRGPLMISQHSQQSTVLAHLLQHSVNELYQSHAKPVRRKSYYLLNHSGCPTVIVEMGYITNHQDRQLLTNPKHQSRIAQAIAAAIDEYLMMFGHLQQEEID